MIDLSHLPQTGGSRMDIFTGQGITSAGGDWLLWTKPRNCSFLYVLAIGGGGGAAGGIVAAAGTAASGGGGGATSITLACLGLRFLTSASMPLAVTGPASAAA